MYKLYGNYRKVGFNRGGGLYTPSYLANQMFSDYEGIVTIKDNEIPENRYTKTNPNGLKNLTRFIVYELDDGVDEEEFRKSVQLAGGINYITLFDTVDEAIADIKDRTDLEEDEDTAGKFLIRDAYTNEDGNDIPAKYLIIE